MNVIRASHMFWQTPDHKRGLMRTVPLRQGGLGRAVGLGGGMFMGQASANRLDAVSIPAIIGRIQLEPVIQAYMSGLATKNAALRGLGMFTVPPRPTPAPNFPPMTAEEAQILFEVSQNPTDEELKDLATIDNLFSQNFVDQATTTNEICYFSSQRPGHYTGFGKFASNQPVTGETALIDYLNPLPLVNVRVQPKKPDTSFLSNKFWCPDPKTLGPTIFQGYLPVLGKSTSFAAMFGIDPNRTWGSVKQAVENGLIMLDVKASYPFPPPVDMAPDTMWAHIQVHLPELANIGLRVDPEAFRMWLTMAVLENYDAVTDAIIKEQKKKAKNAKRKAIIKAVGIAIAGIVLSFILPAIIAAAIVAIKSAVQLYIDAKERQKAAKAMAEAARMFEADAPAFSSEVQKAADMMDSAAAQAEAERPLTAEELSALQEVKDNPEPGQGSDVGTLLVGGVAATGIVAGLIALFR